ncbi:MAG: hypothetical protein EBS30_18965, partial [Planctomycetes bacterium]|nr:hypothetical protein [Planctomycetota bacterium]
MLLAHLYTESVDQMVGGEFRSFQTGDQAQTGKAEVTRLVDRVSEIFVPIVVILALVTTVTWFAITGDSGFAITTGIAVLVIACPCALGLATPTALLVGTGRGAQLGILIRGPHAIESSQKIDVIIMDKTGKPALGTLATPGRGNPATTQRRPHGATRKEPL